LLPKFQGSLAFKGVLLVSWVTTFMLFAGLWWMRAGEQIAAGGEKG
jgi:hypothetical protein